MDPLDHFVGRGVFPEPQNMPAFTLEGKGVLAITVGVSLEFLRPVSCVVLWDSSVVGAAMPKAPVYEDGKPDASKYDVWSALSVSSNKHVVLAESMPPLVQ